MAIDFPNSPSVNQVFTSGSKSWIWNGTSWAGNNNAGFVGSQGYTGSLGYSGSIGYTGSSGYTGSLGYTGSFGNTGYTGSLGYTGSSGYTGSFGYTGSYGIAAVNDSNWAFRAAIMDFEGTNGDTFTNEWRNNVEVALTNGATISNTQFKVGSTSLSLPVTSTSGKPMCSPALVAPLGAGNFTVECWVYPTSFTNSSFPGIWDLRSASSTGIGVYFSGTNLIVRVNSTSNSYALATIGITLNNWSHIAVERVSGTITLYVGGTSQATIADTTSYVSNQLYVASTFDGYAMQGYLDNFRITTAKAVFNGAFTPPTVAYPLTQYNVVGSTTGFAGSTGYTGSQAAPAGANTQVQFNNSSVFGASSSLTWNGTTLTAGNISSSGTLAVTGATTQTGILNLNSVMVEAYSNVSISTNTLTLNLSTAGIFNATLNSNITTVTLSNYPSGAGQAASFILMLTGDGTARSITWPASFRWPGATAPTPTSTLNQRDIYAFFTLDGGTNWQAFISGQNL